MSVCPRCEKQADLITLGSYGPVCVPCAGAAYDRMRALRNLALDKLYWLTSFAERELNEARCPAVPETPETGGKTP